MCLRRWDSYIVCKNAHEIAISCAKLQCLWIVCQLKSFTPAHTHAKAKGVCMRLIVLHLSGTSLSRRKRNEGYTGCPKTKDTVTWSHNFRLKYSKVHLRIERSFLHNVWNLVDITSPLEILNLNRSIESYDSKLRCPSFWDTLYCIWCDPQHIFPHSVILLQGFWTIFACTALDTEGHKYFKNLFSRTTYTLFSILIVHVKAFWGSNIELVCESHLAHGALIQNPWHRYHLRCRNGILCIMHTAPNSHRPIIVNYCVYFCISPRDDALYSLHYIFVAVEGLSCVHFNTFFTVL